MSDDVTAKVLDLVAANKRLPRESLALDSTFEQLEMDSLDAMNLIFEIEECFGVSIPDSSVRSIKNVRELVDQLKRLLADADSGKAPRS